MMKRRKRTQVLIDSPATLARRLAALVEQDVEVVDVTPSHQGLVMCQVRETARNQRFYLGEALMTEVRVRIGSTVGLGAALGADDQLAHDLAVIDAALSQPEPLAACVQIEAELEQAEQALELARARRVARTMASRVSFDTMQGQDMSVVREVK